MSTIATPRNHLTTTTATVRAGLALSAALGLANIPFLVLDIDWGADEPPFALLLLNAAIGMVSVVCAALAWNTGNRRLIRLNAAALIVNALMVLPGIFFESPAFITIASAVIVVATVVAVVLTMRRSDAPTGWSTDDVT
jgi:O-antigen/teichoic acid export membrane protein